MGNSVPIHPACPDSSRLTVLCVPKKRSFIYIHFIWETLSLFTPNIPIRPVLLYRMSQKNVPLFFLSRLTVLIVPKKTFCYRHPFYMGNSVIIHPACPDSSLFTVSGVSKKRSFVFIYYAYLESYCFSYMFSISAILLIFFL